MRFSQYIEGNGAMKMEFKIGLYELAFYDVTREKYCTESGSYTFMIGASSEDIRCEKTIDITGEEIPPRDMSQTTKAKNYDGKDNVTLDFSYDKNDHYAVSGDWGGSLVYKDADMKDYTAAEILCAAPVGGKKLEIYAGEKLIGSADIAPSPRKDGFSLYTIPLEKVRGVMPLRLYLGGMLSVYSMRFS